MEHLVLLNNGTYRIDSRPKEEINKELGTGESIYLSWEEGKREEVLDQFLIGNDRSLDVENELKTKPKEELVVGTRVYFAIIRDVIKSLVESEVITKEKGLELTKQNKIVERQQLVKIGKGAVKRGLKNIFRLD